jgi:hypothetical protein
MNIIKLFDDDTKINNIIENINYDRIVEVLNNNKLSSYEIYTELKKKYPENKYIYKEINKLCLELILIKNGKKICKESSNPSIFYVNKDFIIIKDNGKKRKNITKENTLFEKYNNIKSEKKNYNNIVSNIDNNIISNNNTIKRLKALEKVLEYQYEKFISTKDPKYLDNINELNFVKENL